MDDHERLTHRNADGGVFGSFAQQIPGIFEPLMAELLAIRSGLIFARDSGLKICILESDSSLAVRAIHDGSSSGPGGAIINDIQCLLKSGGDCLCQFVFREANMVAHVLAKHGLSVTSDLFWLEDFPPAAL